ALLTTMGERDQLELIEFSDAPRRWRSAPAPMTERMKKDALAWIAGLRASGGTEMRSGIYEALRPLRAESQRQVVLVTDGLIGFETEVLAEVLGKLPPACRLHTVGVGSSVNRTLTREAARAGRGTEVVIGIGEDPERGAARLAAHTASPLVVDLSLEGSAVEGRAPMQLPDLFGGAPALLSLKLRPEGGEVVVKGRTADGAFEQRVQVPPVRAGEGNPAVAALFGREAVADLELRIAAGQPKAALDEQIEALGLAHQISTRLTSWIAVSDERTVDPGAPSRRMNVPQELPYGASAEGFGLRASAPVGVMPLAEMAAPSGALRRARAGSGAPLPPPAPSASGGPPPPPARRSVLGGVAKGVKDMLKGFGDAFDGGGDSDDVPAAQASRAESAPADEEVERSAPVPAAPKREDAPGEKKKAKVSPPAVLHATGRIALSRDGQLVIEFALPEALGFEPGTEVALLWSDRLLQATVDPARSTRPASLQRGHLVRLALTLPAGAPDDRPEWLELDCGGTRLKVRLTRAP
ncbi:MAG: hypothetical protein ACK4N5_14645, partial [Myxococcales bacterium]